MRGSWDIEQKKQWFPAPKPQSLKPKITAINVVDNVVVTVSSDVH